MAGLLAGDLVHQARRGRVVGFRIVPIAWAVSLAAMSYILLTNDDGVESPALIPFAKALASLAPVRVVVPAQERSWIGKAITRFDEITVSVQMRDGVEVHVADGYPADCTQLGVHSLFEGRPSMVVSGINIGLNSGLGFLLSSGTVGAAAEGWIAGIPAVAFSTGVTDDHASWSAEAWAPASGPFWERSAALAVDILGDILAVGFPAGADVLSVNYTTACDLASSRSVTTLAKVGYDNIFREREPGRFVHDFSTGLRIDTDMAGTDLETLAAGGVAITPVQLAHAGEVSAGFRDRVERLR